MKTSLLLASLLTLTVQTKLKAEATPPTADGEVKTSVMETKTYGLDRYQRLMAKSPFDFEVPEVAPPPPIPAMQDWALAGLTKATDYSVVNLVNLKTQERLRLTRYMAPPSSKANQTKSGSDIFTLESIQFEEGKPMTVKNATAMVTKNGEQGSVAFDAKVLQMKAAPGKGAMPMIPGAQPANGQPVPNNGQPGGANGSNQALLQMLQQRNAAQPQGGGAAPQPTNPGNPAVPNLPNQLAPQGQPAQPQQPVVPQQPAVYSNTGGGTNPAAGANNGNAPAPAARRRVVLPTNEPVPVPGAANQ